MPSGSKMRSARSISCTWYCTVSRSSKAQVAFGPTASCRSALCCSTRARNDGRSRAYCSRGMRSAAQSLFTVSLLASASRTSQPVSDPQQPQWMLRGAWRSEAAFNLMSGHRAIARIVIGGCALHALHHGAADADRGGAKARLHTISTVVTRAALDGIDAAAWNEPQQVTRLQSDVLHAQVTGHVIAHLAERHLEIRAQAASRVAQHQVLERIEQARCHALNLRILGEHERQLLLEHEHAGGNGCQHVEAGFDRREQFRDVALLEPRDSLEITELESRHAAAALCAEERNLDAIVLEHCDQVLGELGLVVIAVAGGEYDDLAACGRAGARGGTFSRGSPGRLRRCFSAAASLGHRLTGNGIAHGAECREAAARSARVINGKRSAAIDAENLFEHSASSTRGVEGVDRFDHHGDARKGADRIGGGEHPLAPAEAPTPRAGRLGPQHQMREVDVPRMGWHVRAFGHEAHVAQIAVVDDIPENLAIERDDFAGIRCVHRIEQCRKCVAEAEAAATA